MPILPLCSAKRLGPFSGTPKIGHKNHQIGHVLFTDYSVEREHSGLRRIAGDGVTVTRGAASGMMFTYGCLLLTMCRNMITAMRETFLNRYIPFDAAVDFHKYISVLALIFTSKCLLLDVHSVFRALTARFSLLRDDMCLISYVSTVHKPDVYFVKFGYKHREHASFGC